MIQDCVAAMFGPRSVAPWAEDNQGLISVIALIVALALFLLEQKRANDAEKRERKQAIDDAALAKAEASAAEIRALETAEAARREERQIAKSAATQAKLDHLHEFATAVRGVIRDVEDALLVDRIAAKKATADQDFGMPAPTEATKLRAIAAAETLKALLTVAPMSPSLIRATCNAMKKLGDIEARATRLKHDQVDENYASWSDPLLASRQEISDAVLERQYQIAPPVEATAPTIPEADSRHI